MGVDPDLIDGYRIHRLLGQGGMGRVFEATDSRFGRRIALKVLNEELSQDEDAQQRFLGEAQTLASLNSPHVVQVFDAGMSRGRLFIAMQLVDGRDLQSILRHTGPLPIPRAVSLISQVGAALDDAHRTGLLHRDVKPHNILVRDAGPREFAYLADFGIARLAESGHTRTIGVIGTPSYMAPEVHQGRRPTPASDIYSLGCVLWAMLRGQPPYTGATDFQVAQGHISGEIPALRGPAHIVGPINDVLARAMAKDPGARWGSVGDMVAALESATGSGGASAATVGATPAVVEEISSERLDAAGTPEAATRQRQGSTEPVASTRTERRRPRRRALLGALVLASTLGAAAGARALFDPSSEADRTEERPTAARSDGGGTAGRQGGDPSPRDTKSTTPDATPAVTCWNGRTAAAAQQCPVPRGRTGMTSVFPSLSDVAPCQERPADPSVGKLEVYVCTWPTMRIRYSRWDPGADRFAYYRAANSVPVELPWRIDEKLRGIAWTSTEDVPSYPYQWSATYRKHPFSVSAEGVDVQSRARAIRRVEAVPPSEVGLAR